MRTVLPAGRLDVSFGHVFRHGRSSALCYFEHVHSVCTAFQTIYKIIQKLFQSNFQNLAPFLSWGSYIIRDFIISFIIQFQPLFGELHNSKPQHSFWVAILINQNWPLFGELYDNLINYFRNLMKSVWPLFGELYLRIIIFRIYNPIYNYNPVYFQNQKEVLWSSQLTQAATWPSFWRICRHNASDDIIFLPSTSFC